MKVQHKNIKKTNNGENKMALLAYAVVWLSCAAVSIYSMYEFHTDKGLWVMFIPVFAYLF